MTLLPTVALTLLLLTLSMWVGGCAAAPHAERFDADSQAVRLSNGDAHLVIDARIGRVIAYGTDSTQVLWTHPEPPAEGYRNLGGDKVWPWPQSAWTAIQQNDWPPPPQLDGLPHTIERLDRYTVRLTSGIVPAWGIRVVRTIRLDRTGTGVTFDNVIEKVDSVPAPPLAAWTITQIPLPAVVNATPISDADLNPPTSPLFGDPWPGKVDTDGDQLTIRVRPDAVSKIGIDADTLFVDLPEFRFTVKSLSPRPAARHEMAQIFVLPELRYLELEFTGPRASLAVQGDQARLVTRWELTRR
jgi:hypothetical protein